MLQGLCIHLFGLDLHLCVLLDGLKGLHSERHMLDLDDHFVFSSQLSLLPDGVHTLPQQLGLVGVVGCREGLLEHVGFHPVLERALLPAQALALCNFLVRALRARCLESESSQHVQASGL